MLGRFNAGGSYCCRKQLSKNIAGGLKESQVLGRLTCETAATSYIMIAGGDS